MATLTVQIGQCGNQLGHAVMEMLYGERSECKKEGLQQAIDRCYFRTRKGGDMIANAVLVDMESKVVDKCLQQTQDTHGWTYQEEATFTQESGAANNWAFGYKDLGARYEEVITQCLR
eukprot:Filipodium_phascolosomae@DN6890_c0_g1_i1.p1